MTHDICAGDYDWRCSISNTTNKSSSINGLYYIKNIYILY